MKPFLVPILMVLLISCKKEQENLKPEQKTESIKSNLRLFGPDGGKILSGTGTLAKKWKILRLYKAVNGDQSTVKIENIGLVDNKYQTDLFEKLPSKLKNASVVFSPGPTGVSGYGGISDGVFVVKLPDGSTFLNQTGHFAIAGTFTPFYKTSYAGIFNNLKLVPTFYAENKKQFVNGIEYKGEFLQIVSMEGANLSDFKATVVLLFYPS